MKKRGQVTIFIIVAIIIIAMAVLIYLLYPKLKTLIGGDSNNPTAFIQSWLEDPLEEAIEKISLQGGSLNPEHFYLYYDNPVEYLCYTNEYYRTCVVQQPMLKSHIESEIENAIAPEVEACFEDLVDSFENKGYDVIFREGNITVELLPDVIMITLSHELTLTKGDTEKYATFRILFESNLYELVSIARSIIDWEAEYGDADTSLYMAYYRGLKVEKVIKEDGTTIYMLTDKETEDKFQFASRSVAWPM